MQTSIYVNLGVKDLPKSIQFFTELGYAFNPQFTDSSATCMIISDNIFCMLVTNEFFMNFTKKEIADAHHVTECATCLSVETKEGVDAIVNKALSLGATENIVPLMLQGDFMYGRSINDLDGHIWEYMWMDMSKMSPTPVK